MHLFSKGQPAIRHQYTPAAAAAHRDVVLDGKSSERVQLANLFVKRRDER
jgi:hypothetical protein